MVTQKRTVSSRILDFFLSYVAINTQADPNSAECPSSHGQLKLGELLASQLREFGLSVAHDKYGYVYATIPSNAPHKVPALCFCAHMDTSPECSGANVKPLLHENYQGQDIIYPDDPSKVLRMADHPELKDQIGHTLVTASGMSLLGSDDKSGLAIIMDLAYYLTQDPNPPMHGEIQIVFTPDEEIGRGVNKINMGLITAKAGYTLDGGGIGSLESENFTAHSATIKITGVSTHPGYAFGKMENAGKIAALIVATLPENLSPEKTQDKEGYIYSFGIEGGLQEAKITLMLRGYSDEEIKQLSEIVRTTIAGVIGLYPNSTYDYEVKEQYRNMREIMDQHPHILEHARTAIRMAGLEPHEKAIRGGTDGARLSFMGLPCPNISAGEHAIHSHYEWTSKEDMEKSGEVVVHLCTVWCEAASK